MKLRYTPEAVRDLEEIRDYIVTVLRNPIAAKRITKMILENCGTLKQFPESGVSLSVTTGYETTLRMLVCENYVAVYRIDENAVSIARIINSRQNYMRFILRDIDQSLE